MIDTANTAPSLSQNAGTPQQGSARPATRDASSRSGKPAGGLTLRVLLKGVLYLAAIILLPGALLGAPLLWWLERRRTRRNSPRPAGEMNNAGRHCAHCA